MIMAPRNIGTSVADDDAHRRDGADDGAALAVDEPSAGVADQDRQQHDDDRPDERGQLSRWATSRSG